MKSVSRINQSAFGRWFWTTDKLLLTLVFVLIGCGVIAVAAASPAVAQRLSGDKHIVDQLYYLKRQIGWVLAGVPLMLLVSMLPVSWAKRAGIAATVMFLTALFLVPVFGSETKGAVRWFTLGGFQLQPSEFLKPAFIITSAWLLALRFDDRRLPTMEASFVLLLVIAALLIRQPDFGQTGLFVAVWMVQAVLAGMSLWILAGLAAAGTAGLGIAYLTVDHVTKRIDQFIGHGGADGASKADTYQIDRALDCFRAGGMFGAGPGEGVMKFKLPEPHTDYIFSVIGEEFGMIACLFIAGLYIAIVVRVFLQLLDEDEPFAFLAAAGLATQFGLQAAINMAVNLKMMPSKGMTLPFISYGGSSFLALSIGMGLLLALTRRNPYAKASPYVERWRVA